MPANPTNQPRRVSLYALASTLDKDCDLGPLRPLREYAQRRGFAVVENT